MSDRLRLGRPPDGRPAQTLRTVTFRVDEETDQALAKLISAVGGPKIRGKLSVVLRRLILDAANKGGI